MRLLRGCFVLAVPLAFLAHVFQIFDRHFWNAGLAYWLDPYFINALLEHWYVSVREGADPSSPTMYFPVRKTLGYSHGLVLYAPFYIPLRLFLHPFLAYNWTVFLVLAAGIVSLYVLFRKAGLTLVESLAMSALFLTSRNVVNEPLSAWTQRASVFLIPHILLLLFVTARMRPGPWQLGLAGVGGFLATLMYVQDFYTAHLAMLFVAAFAAVTFGPRAPEAIRRFRKTQTYGSIAALLTAAFAAAWVLYLRSSGGGVIEVLGFEVRSHDVRRPAVIAAGALLVLVWLNRRFLRLPRWRRPNAWGTAVAMGAAAGALVFLWIYAGAYLEHRAFPEDQLLNQLLPRDPADWTGPLDMLRNLDPYNSWRSYILVLVLTILVWTPQIRAGRRVRTYWLWLLGASTAVFLIPLRFGEFSVWRTFIEPLPGFAVIRDPKRIVYLYELVVALATAALLASFDRKSLSRAAITLLAVFLIVTDRDPDKFGYLRPVAVYDRWIAAPIAMDPSCKSFYIKGASNEYMSRSDHMWSQYSLDALFVSFKLGIPTLNGYSAWAPAGWNLTDPHLPAYDHYVTRWIDRHRLTDVCEFDIEARRMTRRDGFP